MGRRACPARHDCIWLLWGSGAGLALAVFGLYNQADCFSCLFSRQASVAVRDGVDITRTNLGFLREQFNRIAAHILQCTGTFPVAFTLPHRRGCVSASSSPSPLPPPTARRLAPHSARDPSSIPAPGHCLCGVCTFALRLRGFPPGCSGFLPLSKKMCRFGELSVLNCSLVSKACGFAMVNVQGCGDTVEGGGGDGERERETLGRTHCQRVDAVSMGQVASSFDLICYCHIHWDTVKSIVSCALYRQSIPFKEKVRRGCRM